MIIVIIYDKNIYIYIYIYILQYVLDISHIHKNPQAMVSLAQQRIPGEFGRAGGRHQFHDRHRGLAILCQVLTPGMPRKTRASPCCGWRQRLGPSWENHPKFMDFIGLYIYIYIDFYGEVIKKRKQIMLEMCVSFNCSRIKPDRNLFGLRRPLCDACMDRSTFPSSLQFVNCVHTLISRIYKHIHITKVMHLNHAYDTYDTSVHVHDTFIYVRYAHKTNCPLYELLTLLPWNPSDGPCSHGK